MTPTEFHNIVRPIAMLYGASVTSGLRSKKRNKMVGGKENSRHLLDLAADYAIDNLDDKKDFMEECERQGLVAIASNNNAVHIQTP